MPRIGDSYIPRRMTLLKKMRWLRKRAQHWAFNSANGKPVIRWHHGALRELENAWRLYGKRHHPFVKGLYTRKSRRERLLINSLKAKL